MSCYMLQHSYLPTYQGLQTWCWCLYVGLYPGVAYGPTQPIMPIYCYFTILLFPDLASVLFRQQESPSASATAV